MNGIQAIELLGSLSEVVALSRKDNTDKLWSYKIKGAKHTEFAFNPKTTDRVICWFDRVPPDHPDITQVERMTGKSASTALDRVFSGGIHKANYCANVLSEDALRAFVSHFADL